MNLIEIYIQVLQVFTADINLFHLWSSGTDILESEYKRYLDYSKFSSVLHGINMIVLGS